MSNKDTPVIKENKRPFEKRLNQHELKKVLDFTKSVYKKFGNNHSSKDVIEKVYRSNKLRDNEFRLFTQFYPDFFNRITKNIPKEAFGTKMSTFLGKLHPNYIPIQGGIITKTKDDGGIKGKIVKLANESEEIINVASSQSLSYTGFIHLVSMNYGPNTTWEYHLDPMLACFFLPKIKFIEDRVINSSLAEAVRARLQNKAPQYESDLHFLTDLTRYYNSSLDDNEDDLLSDLLHRCMIQEKTRHSILAARQGRIYDKHHKSVLSMITESRSTHIENPHQMYNPDEGWVLSKFLEAFSIRLFGMSVVNINSMGTPPPPLPYTLRDIKMKGYVTIQLPDVGVSADQIANTPHGVDMMTSFNKANWFSEKTENGDHVMVPKQQKLSFVHGDCIIFYANRRKPSAAFLESEFAAQSRFSYKRTGFDAINAYPVHVKPVLEVLNKAYRLASVMMLNTRHDKQDNAHYITNPSSLVVHYPDENEGDTNASYYEYDPIGAPFMKMKERGEGNPLSSFVRLTEDKFYQLARNNGCIYIYSRLHLPRKDEK